MSLNFNQVILAGNLTRDPQIRILPDNTQIAAVGIAVNRKWKSKNGEMKEEVMFIDCDAFGKTAEMIGQYFTKGQGILITGRLKLDTWEDKQGQKHYKHKVMVDEVKFTTQKATTGDAPAPAAGAAAPAAAAKAGPSSTPTDDEPPF